MKRVTNNNGMSDTENKPKASPVQRKKPKTDAEALEKKEFLKIYNQVYPAYANFATACEKTFMPKKPAKAPRTAGRGEAGTGAVEKHLDRAIISAESGATEINCTGAWQLNLTVLTAGS